MVKAGLAAYRFPAICPQHKKVNRQTITYGYISNYKRIIDI